MVAVLASCNPPASEPSPSSSPSASATPASSDAFLSALSGTYEELFPVLNAAKYDEYWLERITEFVGADSAAATADMLKTVCTSTIYGAEAIAAFPDPESARFNCYFINGVDSLTFDGNAFSGSLNGAIVMFSESPIAAAQTPSALSIPANPWYCREGDTTPTSAGNILLSPFFIRTLNFVRFCTIIIV
ncbi:MAG: hypothetical protein LBC65_03420 [Oscillospiraceae bacterium]|nr:hypothetical protein [Oscillospiraceae bacterium]